MHGSDVKTHLSLVSGLTLSTGFHEGRSPTEYLKQVFNPSPSEIVNLERTSGFLKFNPAEKTSSDLGTKLKIKELDATPSHSEKPLCWRPSWGPHTACQEPPALEAGLCCPHFRGGETISRGSSPAPRGGGGGPSPRDPAAELPWSPLSHLPQTHGHCHHTRRRSWTEGAVGLVTPCLK